MRFPEFTGEWENCVIGDYGRVVTGNTPDTSHTEYYGGKHLWVSPVDLGKSKMVRYTAKTLTDAGLAKTRKVSPRSILVTCIGSTIGKMGMASCELSTNQQINSIDIYPAFDNDFVYYNIQSAFPRYLREVAVQAVPILSNWFRRLDLPRYLIVL